MFTKSYNFDVESVRHSLTIKDVVFSPETRVKAGRALLSTVRIKNTGDKDEDSIKITVAIPELDLSASDYIEELDEGKSTTSEELYMRVPNCAEAGDYEAVVTVKGSASTFVKFILDMYPISSKNFPIVLRTR